MKPHDSFTDKDRTDAEIYKKTGIMPVEDEALANVAGGMVVDTEIYWPDLWVDAYYDLVGISGGGGRFIAGSMYHDERYEEVLDKLYQWKTDMGKTGDFHTVPDSIREFWDPATRKHYKG